MARIVLYTLILIASGFAVMCTGANLMIDKPRIWPLAVQLKQTETMNFRTTLKGKSDAPEKVILERMNADGTVMKVLGPMEASDPGLVGRELKGVFTVEAKDEGDLLFRVTAVVGGKTLHSPVASLMVTRFPLQDREGLERADDPVDDPSGTGKALPDTIMVAFNEDVAPDVIQKRIDEAGCKVMRYLSPQRRTFVIWIPKPWTSEHLAETIKTFQGFAEVKYAEPNGVMTTQ